MKKGSIVFKLFAITTLFFSAFLLIFMVGQTLFFKSFYLNTKISSLKKNITAFTSLYVNNSFSDDVISKKVNEFSNDNNAQIAILDKYGDARYAPSYEITLITADKKKIKIPLSNIAYLEEFQQLKLSLGSKIEVVCYIDDNSNQSISLQSIKIGEKKWENTNLFITSTISTTKVQAIPKDKITEFPILQSKPGVTSAGKTVSIGAMPAEAVKGSINSIISLTEPNKIVKKRIYGTILDLNIPSQIEQMSDYNKSLLWASIEYWKELIQAGKITADKNKIKTFHYIDFSGRDNLAFVSPIVKNNSIFGYIFTISSLQPVGEAVDAMKNYYMYALIAALIIIAVMALLFSRIISNPLVKMNQIAMKMADLDFSEECDINSKDELGGLSNSLNHLSKNLNISLTELKSANEKLQLDIEKERSLETMRKEFISSVSHEFKTPLGILKGFAEGLKDNVAENKKSYYIDVILDEIEKMDELVLDLLDLSKLESKAYKLNLENFYIIDLIDEINNRLLDLIDKKKINIVVEFTVKTIEVHGDYRQIEQVITNIFTNAIRHTEYGGFIKFYLKETGDHVSVSIENSGTHISEEDLPKIWDRFYRAEKSRDRKTGGTGLGLCIVKNILELHECKYGVENTIDGVKFYFTLPTKNIRDFS